MQLVVVEWIDAAKITNETYEDSVDVDSRLGHMKTVGWIHQQSKKTIVLAQETDGEQSIRDWIAIPKVLITKMTKMTKAKEPIR